MPTAIAQIVASAVAYFAARGIDAIIGKYWAAITIGFEKGASARGLEAYREGMKQVGVGAGDKWKDWEKWRNGT